MNLEELKNKASKIKLMAFDVDGVFTDGSLIYDENGKETKVFNAKDGPIPGKVSNSVCLAVLILTLFPLFSFS